MRLRRIIEALNTNFDLQKLSSAPLANPPPHMPRTHNFQDGGGGGGGVRCHKEKETREPATWDPPVEDPPVEEEGVSLTFLPLQLTSCEC